MQISEQDSLFLSSQLEQVIESEQLQPYRSMARSLFTIDSSVQPWADSVSSVSRTSFGEAELIGYRSLLPIIGSFRQKRITTPVVAIGGAAEYTVQEVEQAQALGINLNSLEVQTLTDSIYRREDRLVFKGSDADGVYGIGNHPLITQVFLEANGNANGFTNTSSWLGKTAQQIASELAEVIRVQNEVSEMSNAPAVDTLLLPSTVAAHLASTFTSEASGATMLSVLRQTFPQIQFGSVAAMNNIPIGSLGGASDSAALLYNRASGVQVTIPRDVTFEPAQAFDLKYHIPAHSRFGGIKVNYPESTLLLIGI